MPDWKAEIRERLAKCDLDPAKEAAIVEELADHAADRYEDFCREGLTEREAYQRTRAELADAKLPAGLLERESPPRALLSRHLPFAARVMTKYWRLSVVAVLSLAIAIAASVIGISVFNALLLRPLAAAEPERLVTLYESSPGNPLQQISFADYKFLRDNNHAFSGLAAFGYGFNLLPFTGGNVTAKITVGIVSENYFEVLGVRPITGRFFAGDDSEAKAELVISYALWKRLGADPAIAGKTMRVQGRPVAIVGVASKDFIGTLAGFSIDAWAPIRFDQAVATQPSEAARIAAGLDNRSNRWLTPIGRLKPGIERSAALADVRILGERLAHDFPDTNRNYSAGLVPAAMLPAGEQGVARMFSWTVAGVVFLVLLAASANVVNLLLGLAAARRLEMLIRAALGATRGRLVRQVLRECSGLCVASGALGFSLAYLGLERLFRFHPVLVNGIPPLVLDFRADSRVMALAVMLLMLVTLAIGVVPALHTSIPNLAGALNGEIAVGGTRKRRARAALVVVQTAVCTVVLVGAGLCLRSLQLLKNVPLGFSGRNLVEVLIGASDPSQQRKLIDAMRREIAALPGVNDVTLASSLPLGGQGFDLDQVAPEGEEKRQDRLSEVRYSIVEGNYFSMLGIPQLAGRTFQSSDHEGTSEVILVNQTLAQKYWPGQSAVGKRLRIGHGKRVAEIVGVVGDSKYTDLDEPQLAFMFLAVDQHPGDAAGLVVIAGTGGNARLWMEPLRAVAHKHDPSAFCLIVTLEDQVNFSLLLPRIIFTCVGGFGLLALILSMAGLYATISYSVSERRKEIGIRIALGARPHDVMATLLQQSALATAIGLLLGLGLGIAMSAMLGSLLYGIRPVEGEVLVLVLMVTSFIALLTAYSAAHRWMKIDPLEAVRHA